MIKEDSIPIMSELVAKMVKSRQDSGYVVFILTRGIPVALPMSGRPCGTWLEAEALALEQLTRSPVEAAWIVSAHRGIVEVHERERPKLAGRGILPIDIACPLCLAAGRHTIGGERPSLYVLEEGDDGRTFCLTHGFVYVNEE